MTDFVRIEDALGFHRTVPADQVPDDARVLKGAKAVDSYGQALAPTVPADVDKADVQPTPTAPPTPAGGKKTTTPKEG